MAKKKAKKAVKKTAKRKVAKKKTAKKKTTKRAKRPSAAMMKKSMTGGECSSCK